MKFPENSYASLCGLEVGRSWQVCLPLLACERKIRWVKNAARMEPQGLLGPQGLRSSLSTLCLFSLKSGMAWLSHCPGMLGLNEIWDIFAFSNFSPVCPIQLFLCGQWDWWGGRKPVTHEESRQSIALINWNKILSSYLQNPSPATQPAAKRKCIPVMWETYLAAPGAPRMSTYK